MAGARTVLEVGATVAVTAVALAVGGSYLWDRHASRNHQVAWMPAYCSVPSDGRD